MKCAIAAPGLIFLLGGLALGQETSKKAAFDAADVHVSAPGTDQDQNSGPDGRLDIRGFTLLRLISFAYSTQPDRISGGPSWIDVDRYDVVAKTAPNTPQLAMRTMLQSLLADRFGLSLKNEEKEQPVYALVVGKHGPKESSGEGDSECKRSQEDGLLTLTCKHTTMATVAEQLPRSAPAYFDRPLVDRTGLKGVYDFKIQWMGRGALPLGPEGKALHIFSSIEKQLDIKVESQTAPAPVLSIDKVNRTPAPNPEGTVEALGAPPTEFEVAEIKPSRPDEKQEFNMRNGRIDARAITLKLLIGFAYNVDEDDMVRGEKWLDTDHFNIMAKTVPTASADTLRTMVRAALADRFKLKVHKESQPVNVYVLTAPKPRLKEADPSARSTCKGGAIDGARVLNCQNTTMAQFAEKIQQNAGGYLDHIVVDGTGLTGSYDFNLSWSPVGVTRGGPGHVVGATERAGGSEAGVPTGSDPTGGLTVFQAIEKQLGLKLALQKHPMPVVVVDHIERLPTEN